MSSSPVWKVYDSHGVYQAACKEIEAAAVVAALYGEGSTIRYQHSYIVWTDGKDGWAGDSADKVAETVMQRMAEINQKSLERAHAGR